MHLRWMPFSFSVIAFFFSAVTKLVLLQVGGKGYEEQTPLGDRSKTEARLGQSALCPSQAFQEGVTLQATMTDYTE